MTQITYEITATVVRELRESYEIYMVDRHIPDLMATGAFTEATFSRSGPGRYRIRYDAVSRKSLDDYIRDHAPRLRADFAENFPRGVELSREEWEILAQFDGDKSTR